MKSKKHFLIALFIGFFSCINTYAQHDLQVVINSDGTTTESSTLNGVSDMFTGCIEKDFIQMDRILSGEDGEITFDVQAFNSNENLEFRLVSVSNANDHFTLQFQNESIFLTENYNGVSRVHNLGLYAAGDAFKVIRCNGKILYRVKGMIVHVTQLIDNDFDMYGEVIVNTTSGVDFEAQVTFHPLGN